VDINSRAASKGRIPAPTSVNVRAGSGFFPNTHRMSRHGSTANFAKVRLAGLTEFGKCAPLVRESSLSLKEFEIWMMEHDYPGNGENTAPQELSRLGPREAQSKC
jgi:hypothetical protein